MEDLLARHRKEAKDLQARVSQKKKSATKKTRKAVNEECEALERELRLKQEQEIKGLEGEQNGTVEGDLEGEAADTTRTNGVTNAETTGKRDEPDAAVEEAQSHKGDKDIEDALGKLSLYGNTESRSQRKPNKQRARLARRAAEREQLARQAADEADDMPDLKERERKSMMEQFEREGLKEKIVRADGHCLYAAVAEGLKYVGLDLRPKIFGDMQLQGEDYRVVRKAAANYMEQHPDDFTPFLEEPMDRYVTKVRDTGEWGGQLELLALAKAYGVDIDVLQADGGTVTINGDGDADTKRQLWLAYYKHNFGLGEHYNCLRKES